MLDADRKPLGVSHWAQRHAWALALGRHVGAVLDTALVATIRTIIEAEPAAGLRMITARVRRASPVPINRKKVHRILKVNGWQVRQRPRGQRPRVQGWVSRTTRPNERWAVDTTHLFCGRDGWCHLTAIIDCCDRTIVGWRLSRSGIAHVAAAALEDALRERSIPHGHEPLTLRSDNGLVFGAKVFVSVVRRYGLEAAYSGSSRRSWAWIESATSSPSAPAGGAAAPAASSTSTANARFWSASATTCITNLPVR